MDGLQGCDVFFAGVHNSAEGLQHPVSWFDSAFSRDVPKNAFGDMDLSSCGEEKLHFLRLTFQVEQSFQCPVQWSIHTWRLDCKLLKNGFGGQGVAWRH